MPTYADLVARIVPRLRMAMQAQQNAAPIDEGYIEQCMLELLGEVVETPLDLDALIIFDVPLFTTATGVRTYPLPANFGRTLTFREPQQTGIECDNGTTKYQLYKAQAQDFIEGKSSTNGRPAQFILTSGGMTLDPPPDANGSVGSYTIRGSYVQSTDLNTFDWSQDVRLMFPQALQDATQARYLGQDTMPWKQKIINGEAKQEVEFQWQYTAAGQRRWHRGRRR